MSKRRLLVAGVQWPLETFLGNLARGLAAHDIEVTLACPGPVPTDSGLKQLFVPSWERPLSRRLLRLFWETGTAAMRSFTDCQKFLSATSNSRDSLTARLAHVNHLMPFAGRTWDAIYFPWNDAAAYGLPLFDLGCPVVISCRGAQVNIAPVNPRRSRAANRLRKTFEKATAVHCVSQAMQNEAAIYGLKPDKSWIIRPAVDESKFSPPENRPASRTLRIISTGSLIWRKGWDYALASVAKLHHQGTDVRFTIIGDGTDRSRLRHTINDLGIQDIVRLCGKLPPDQVKRCLEESDVFILSSLSEGIANVVLEAMAVGLPVVTSDCGGMREAVSNGIEGFVVPVRDSEAMASALTKLAKSPSLRLQMGEAGRKRILKEFTLKSQLEQWVRLLDSVMPVRSNRRQ